jgi:hypothetical protein
MSVVAIHRLVRNLERQDGAVAGFLADPEAFIAGYPLTERETDAVLTLDAQALVDLGVNPLVMRTLLVLSGVQNSDIYSHDSSLRQQQQ